MKRNILIPLGFLIIVIAIVNSLADFELFPLSKDNKNTNNISTMDQQVQGSSTLFNFNELNAGNAVSTVTLDKFVVPGPVTDFDDTSLESNPNTGFLPVQVEKSEMGNVFAENSVKKTIPTRIIINDINLDAPVVEAEKTEFIQDGITYNQWSAPDEFAVGWHGDSAYLGSIGNTVINGHHNVFGEVFKDLNLLKEGGLIILLGEDGIRYTYIVSNVMILPERDVSIDQRLDNARWIMPSLDERLTLITCWPSYSNTHRLIIVAKPESSVIFSQMPEQ